MRGNVKNAIGSNKLDSDTEKFIKDLQERIMQDRYQAIEQGMKRALHYACVRLRPDLDPRKFVEEVEKEAIIAVRKNFHEVNY